MNETSNNMRAHIIDHTPARPKVSVIMLAYNSAAYLPVSISSVLRQKASFDVQLVLSDDCSSDKATLEICRQYAKAFPDKITLITHDANRGIPRNFIDAHRACKGDYIAMCDADDYWCDEHKLSTMVGYMDAHPECAMAFHRVINYYEDKGTKSLSNGAQRLSDYNLADLCAGNFITNCSALYRRSACPVVPHEVGDILLCDYAMHLLSAMSGSVHYFAKLMAVYRKRSDALWTGVKATRRYRDALRAREFGLKLLSEHHRSDEYRIMVDNYTANALSCLAAAQAEGMEMPDIVARLRHLHPEWTADELQRRVTARIAAARRSSLSSRMRRAASVARALVSRFIPLPKVTPLLP